jgi:hypothetical protein
VPHNGLPPYTSYGSRLRHWLHPPQKVPKTAGRASRPLPSLPSKEGSIKPRPYAGNLRTTTSERSSPYSPECLEGQPSEVREERKKIAVRPTRLVPLLATVVALIDAGPRSPALYGRRREKRRREEVLRKKLALLVAAAVMMASVLAFASVASAVTYSSATATASATSSASAGAGAAGAAQYQYASALPGTGGVASPATLLAIVPAIVLVGGGLLSAARLLRHS